MATQTDTGQLKKLGGALIGAGALMVIMSFVMSVSWQLYGGLVAVALGVGALVFAFKKS